MMSRTVRTYVACCSPLACITLLLLSTACSPSAPAVPALAPTLASTALPLATAAPTSTAGWHTVTAQTDTPTRPASGGAVLTATPTITPIIPAVEKGTRTPTGAGTLWTGTMTADTFRVYHDPVSLAENMTCKTNWTSELSLIVDQSGKVSGKGQSHLSSVSCPRGSNYQMADEEFQFAGSKEDQAFDLLPGLPKLPGGPTAELGGFHMLFSQSACSVLPFTWHIPLTSPDSASADLHQNVQAFQNCQAAPGTKLDIFDVKAHIQLNKVGECGALPPSGQNSPAAQLCQP